jgi:hypothetical protein
MTSAVQRLDASSDRRAGGTNLVSARGPPPTQRYWAIAMTLIQTAKLDGVEPMAFLTDVLERAVSGRTKAQALQTLLPWDWAPITPRGDGLTDGSRG